MRKKLFYTKSCEALECVAASGGGSTVLGDIQGQTEWGSEQPDLTVDVPIQCRRVGLDVL